MATAPAALSAQELEEIIVSARKMEESVQEVPVSVTAFTGATLQSMNLQDLDDIAKVTAGFTFDPEFNRTSNRPVIRGQANILGDSGVSYFIDGVYITGSINDYDINDIERIEIVKGPQSALYGRNTYSGAINIITKSPGDTWAARALVEATGDEQQEFSATIKGPVTDAFGVGLTARYYNLDGAWTNIYDGSDIGTQESTSISAVATFEPSDRFRARARAYYNETRDGQPPLYSQPAALNNCFEDNGALYNGLGRYYCGIIEPRPINTDWPFQAPDARDDNDTLQASLQLEFDFSDSVTLTSITGYNDVESAFVIDGDYAPESFSVANFTPNGFPFAGFPVPPFDYAYVGSIPDFTFALAGTSEDISQELRLSISGERTSFLIGAYYFDQENTSRSVRNLPPGAQDAANAAYFAELARMQGVCAANPICATITPFFGPTIVVPDNSSTSDITNMALFGMAAFDLTDRTTLTLEARWAEEEIDLVSVVKDVGSPPSLTVTPNATFTSINPRITLDHRLSDTNMVYALVAAGNKPGGFNAAEAVDAGLPSYDEEEVISVEIGSKNVLADGQLTANFAMYFNQIDGYQITQNARTETTTVSAITNAGDAEILGLETELLYRPIGLEGLTLMFNYTYTDAEFVSGRDENLGLLEDVADDGLVNCSTGNEFPDPDDPTACTPEFASIDGKRIPRTAEQQLFFDIELRRPFGTGGWDWFAGANFSHESSKFAQVVNFAETGDTSLVNARLGLASDRYRVSLWGKNLTGEDTTPLALRYADGNDSFKRNFVGTQRRDTYFGLTASARFE